MSQYTIIYIYGKRTRQLRIKSEKNFPSRHNGGLVSPQHFDHCDDANSLSIRVQTTLNHIRFVFDHNIKDNERNLCQDLLTTRTSKCTRCAMQMSYLYASDFCSHNMQKKQEKMFGKRVMMRTRCR